MKDEEQIKQVIALQNQIEDMKKEVSKILGEVIKNNKLMTLGCRIVMDGELWELTRWPYLGRVAGKTVKASDFGGWKLASKGKVMS